MITLVTGGTGFVGRALLRRMSAEGIPLRAAVRADAVAGADVRVDEIGPDTDWSAALDAVGAVIHLAGRAHIVRREPDSLAEFRRINAAGTARLAAQAEAAGVKRFILVSSVKAAADSSVGALRETMPPAPGTPYGVSKLEGELALGAAARRMETVVLRPPLVYGPEVSANFRALLRLVHSGFPLPLGSVRNRRSLIARENLVDAILRSRSGPTGTFFIADGPPLSTPALVCALARALGKPARLVPFPPGLLKRAAALAGRTDAADSLLGSLEVDDSAFRSAFGWTPRVTPDAAFAAVAAWFKRLHAGAA